MRHRLYRCLAAVVLGTPGMLAVAADFSSPFDFAPAPITSGRPVPAAIDCGARRLHPERVAAPRPYELSALAWDADEGVLYALSDRGLVVHLRPRFRGRRLVAVTLQAVYPLLGSDAARLPRRFRDAEGLAARRTDNGRRGDSELLVSFEHGPRVIRYSPRGEHIGPGELPVPLRDAARYQGANRQLEALTLHPAHGIIVAPERPLDGTPDDRTMLYAGDGGAWWFSPFDAAHSDVTALETLPQGDLLVLCRRLRGIFHPIVFTLYRLTPGPAGAAAARELARFDSNAGWAVDNFEGIAHYADTRYLMVSDDNGSPLQATVLVCLDLARVAQP